MTYPASALRKSSKRIKSSAQTLSPFFDKDNNVVLQIPHIAWKKVPHNNSKIISTSRFTYPRKSFENPAQWTPHDPFYPTPKRLNSWKVIHHCKSCIQFDARIRQPLLRDLPLERIFESFP